MNLSEQGRDELRINWLHAVHTPIGGEPHRIALMPSKTWIKSSHEHVFIMVENDIAAKLSAGDSIEIDREKYNVKRSVSHSAYCTIFECVRAWRL